MRKLKCKILGLWRREEGDKEYKETKNMIYFLHTFQSANVEDRGEEKLQQEMRLEVVRTISWRTL